MVMESCSNERRVSSGSLDRLSSLPVELINMVLNRVPLTDAVRTSALSRFWRCRWMLVPDLIFDGPSIPPSKTKPVDFVNHVLFLHDGNVSRFEIRNYLDCSSPDVDRWIRLLSRKSVRELILEFPVGCHYKLPSTLFLCQNLRRLKLHCCILNMPPHLKGTCNLVDLNLRSVTLTNETIASLIVNCPLRRLSLISCDGFNRLNIYAPNLEEFSFYGPCESFNFGNTPNLYFAYMGVLPPANQILNPSRNGIRCNLKGLINVEELHVVSNFLKILILCSLTGASCLTFPRLIYLYLEMNLDAWNEVLPAIILIRSSACLETITITNCSSGQVINQNRGTPLQTQLCREEGIFLRLTAITLHGFKGRQLEMRFLQYVLSNAGVLQTMSIMWGDGSVQTLPDKTHVLGKLLQFERASPRAKVVLLNQV